MRNFYFVCDSSSGSVTDIESVPLLEGKRPRVYNCYDLLLLLCTTSVSLILCVLIDII